MLVKQIRLPSHYDAAFRKQLTESAKAIVTQVITKSKEKRGDLQK